MTDRISTAIIAALCVIAAATTVFLAARSYRSDPPVAIGAEPSVIRDWRGYTSHAYRVSSGASPITIIEFSDLQCPFCRKLAFELDTIESRYPGRITVLFHNYPLDEIHVEASLAAIAAECANEQGAFARFASEVFANQGQLGARPMQWFASRAGVADLARFERCRSDSASARPLAVDRAMGQRLAVEGTPTILIDSMRYIGAPSLATIDSVVRRLDHHS
jgi:protein-disulfide isomerase